MTQYHREEREAKTREVMDAGAPLIYSARLSHGDLLGEPDLLRKEGDGYIAGDIKSGVGYEGDIDEEVGNPSPVHHTSADASRTDRSPAGQDPHRSAGGIIQARSSGCLCKPIPLYGTGRPVEWVNAFILGYLGRRSDTLYSIPIMDNRCILPDGSEVAA